ncbi:hypothetical protein RIF23_11355 [Lipingzhangella sp. LS1_29]|uniref:Secreted protein n=1 Tax=Lipingzhangella rawalii TaxID=2055835 RepID=A0ABU2H6H3_9ACTN|nr:hypothetical protein [Lipingzhangella rawalii]MDS1270898.1 hypothetical protein [Lipingzhangella rawalii]
MTRNARHGLPVAAAMSVGLIVAACGTEPEAEGQDTTANGAPEEQREQSAGELLSETAPDGHPLREIPAEEAPDVQLEVEPDSHDGWNVHLDVTGFEFTPQHSGDDAVGGQGHAHLYVGEDKHRLYGPWFHLPAEEGLGEGEHTISVTLNADDHTTWAVDGAPIEAEASLDGDGETAAEPHDHGDDDGDDHDGHED